MAVLLAIELRTQMSRSVTNQVAYLPKCLRLLYCLPDNQLKALVMTLVSEQLIVQTRPGLW